MVVRRHRLQIGLAWYRAKLFSYVSPEILIDRYWRRRRTMGALHRYPRMKLMQQLIAADRWNENSVCKAHRLCNRNQIVEDVLTFERYRGHWLPGSPARFLRVVPKSVRNLIP